MSERLGYDVCRPLLARLRADDHLVDVVDSAGAARGWWPAGRRWRREYGRFDLGGEPLVTLLFESPALDGLPQALCTVDVWHEAADANGDRLEAPGLGWLSLRRFSDDDAMPWLPDVLALPGAPTVLRYRPGKRCTLRVDHADGTPTFVKVFNDSTDGTAMHVDAVALAAAADAGDLSFDVAPSLGWDATLHTFTQGSVAGVPAVRELFTADGAPLAERMGAAVATLAVSTLRPSGRAPVATAR